MKQFLKTAVWVVLAMLIMLFAVTNWTPVTIRLWGGNQLETKLPLVVIIAFLSGALPVWALHKATRWSLKRRLESAERALSTVAQARQPAAPPPSPPLSPADESQT